MGCFFKKEGDKFYEITFTTSGVKGWQLYAPGQSFDESKSAEITLSDSTIGQTTIEDTGLSKIIKSQVFDNAMLRSMKMQRFGNRQFISTVLFRSDYRVS
jgi:hypothetical protein